MQKKVVIIGGGPASMLLAAHLDSSLFNITIYEKNSALARKFLVAGKGGFNLTHSESLDELKLKYTPSFFLEEILSYFSNTDLIKWLNKIGIPTFIGSSKRVYPEKGIKPIEVLTAILTRLKQNNITIKTACNWIGWNNNNELIFDNGLTLKPDITIFGLGGASWSKTGSNGSWTPFFQEKGLQTLPFQASNCAYQIDWKASFILKAKGLPIKNITISCNNSTKIGEVVITKFGIEGGAIYALSPEIRTLFNKDKQANITFDLKPHLTVEEIIGKVNPDQPITKQLSSKLKLEKIKIELLKHYLKKEAFLDPLSLATYIKSFPLKITAIASVEESISTVGGIALDEIDTYFQLKKMPNHYSIGEMLDFDAPTGGYLLQSCFSMGAYLASHLNKKHGKKN